MVIKIKLYGDLSVKFSVYKNERGLPSTLNIKPEKVKTVFDILNQYNIRPDEISHIFINNKYSRIENQIKDGDRIGIFPKRMGIIFVEIIND
ncbi:MAG: MoaD/ThiS family protein [Promethearchaeota archaeon]